MQVKDVNRSRRGIGVLSVVCLLLQLAIAPNIALGSGHANVACVYAGLVALAVGGRTGIVAGFAAGLVYDLSTTGPVGLMALLLTVVSFLLGQQERNRLLEDQMGAHALFAVSALAVCTVYHLCMLALGQSDSPLDTILFRVLPSTLLTVICYLPFAFLLARASVGGAGGKHVGRYTLGGR